MKRRSLLGAGLAALSLLAAPAAFAQDKVLRVGTFLAPQGVWHGPLKHFIDTVNGKNAGLKLELVADPSSVNPFQLGNAVQSGVIQVAYISGAFYTNLVPEADANKLFNIPVQELRKNGAIALIDDIHRKKMRTTFLGKVGDGVKYHLYTRRSLDKPDFKGLNMRGTPLYRPYLQALGANVVQMQGSEVYPAMESGVVDGYPWPLWGIKDLGLLEVTKFRVEPGFYNAEIGFLVNLAAWNGLTDAQRKAMTDAMVETENWFIDYRKTVDGEQRAIQDGAGIKPLTFSEAENKKLVQTADDAGWEVVIRNSPENGQKLKDLTYRAN